MATDGWQDQWKKKGLVLSKKKEMERVKIEGKQKRWNKTNLKLIFFRTDFRPKLVPIKTGFKISR